MTLTQRVLYLTLDGVLEPLGRSQVLNYIYRLSGCGFHYTLISLEHERALVDVDAVRTLELEINSYGIKWLRLPYHTGRGVRDVLKNCYTLFRAAWKEQKRESIRLVHARSYISAAIGLVLHKFAGIPYLFDMRGYWIDELADEGRWFGHPAAYRVGKWVERKLLKNSAAIVTLTQLQADDLRADVSNFASEKLIAVIPTCADYRELDFERPLKGIVPSALRSELMRKLTVGWVGSINASYCFHESLFLFRLLLEKRSDAHLLCLTQQQAEMESLLQRANVPKSAYTLKSVLHQDIAEWLLLMDWALLLLNSTYSKRGSMPTKLAEFFAAGVRPIQYGCNSEVSEYVHKAGSGIVLKGLSEADLREAAQRIATTPLQRDEVVNARNLTRSYFSIESGVSKYETLLAKLFKDHRA
jgi:glycosyltransferase involved in cell wall biosynthesis